MKIIYSVLSLLLLTVFTCHAQEKKRDTIGYQPTTKEKIKIKRELGLSKKQVKELKASNSDFKQQLQDIKTDSTLSQQERREALKNLQQQRRQKMDSVLTPAQQEKIKALRKEKREQKKTDKPD
jgi:Spy/CpxP family protein refolding chaperone